MNAEDIVSFLPVSIFLPFPQSNFLLIQESTLANNAHGLQGQLSPFPVPD